MEMAKVTSKGQITIPVSIRRRLKISEGDKLLFIDSPDGVIMVNPDMLPAVRGAESPEPVIEYLDVSGASAQDARPQSDGAAAAGTLEDEASAASASWSTDAAADASRPNAPGAAAAATSASAAAPPPDRAREKSDAKVHGFDLNSLIDEIRSIGSKI